MEKLIVNGDTPISCFRGVVCGNVVVVVSCFSLPLAVQGQVPRYCMLPKGPLSPPKQPGCYHRRDTGC